MTKHIILWQLADMPEDRKAEVKAGIKTSLEALAGVVPGLRSIRVYTEGLATSNADVMLETELDSPEALKAYAVHPAHVAAADTYVRPYTRSRVCFDFEV